MKKIVILGSSGGNLYNLGGADPEKLLSEIYTQCQSPVFLLLRCSLLQHRRRWMLPNPLPPPRSTP